MEARGLEEADDRVSQRSFGSVRFASLIQVIRLYQASGGKLHTAEKRPWATQLGRSARPAASPVSAPPSASAGGLGAAGMKEEPTASAPCFPPGPSATCRPSYSQSSGCPCWASWGCVWNTVNINPGGNTGRQIQKRFYLPIKKKKRCMPALSSTNTNPCDDGVPGYQAELAAVHSALS